MNTAARIAPSAPHAGHPVARILLGAWQQGWNRQERWGLWVLAAVPLLPTGLMFLNVGLGLAVGCVIGLLVLAGSWATTVSNVLEQNQPTAARLVPGHVRRLRLALAAGAALSIAAAVVLGAAFVACLQLSAAGRAMEISWALVLPGIASAAALAVVAMSVVVRWPSLGYFAFLFPFGALFRAGTVFTSLGAATMLAWRATPVLASALLAVVALGLPAALLQSGGADHERAYARRRNARERFRLRALGLEPGVAQQDGWAAAVFRARGTAYQRWFARLLKRPSSPMSRLALGLGPAGHWTTLLSSLLTMTAVAAVVLTVMVVLGPPEMPASIAGGLTLGLMAMAATPLFQLRARYHQSRGEQALLVLLPGVPRRVALARGLALRATREFAIAWVVMFGLSRIDVAQLARIDPAASALTTAAGVVAVAVLPLALLAWRRLDRLSPPSQGAIFGELLLMVLLAGVAWGVHLFAGVPLAVEGAVAALATAAGCAWRWRRMAGEPAPLPAGR